MRSVILKEKYLCDLKREKIGTQLSRGIMVIDQGYRPWHDWSIVPNNPEKWSECLNSAIKRAHFAKPQSWRGFLTPVVMEENHYYDPSLELAASTCRRS